MEESNKRLLIVEDNPADARLVQEFLREESRETFEVGFARDMSEAKAQLSNNNYDIALLDLGLPDSKGLNTIAVLRSHAPNLPIIVLTGSEDESEGVEAVRCGAQDYLAKSNLDGYMLGQMILYAVERKRQEQHLRKMSRHDSLTSLPNRRYFAETLKRAHHQAGEDDRDIAVFFLDIDNFKLINDTLGHAAGDEVLQTVGERIRNSIRYEDFVARLGGDEFAVLIQTTERTHLSLPIIANKILLEVIEPIVLEGSPTREEVRLTVSMGISMYSDCTHPSQPDDLLNHADTAMYQAKSSGGNNYCFYDSAIEVRAKQRMMIATGLKTALEKQEFRLCYQPIVDARTNSLFGLEVLLRWSPRGEAPISPSEFIPMLEETYQIAAVGEWILDSACGEYRSLVDAGVIPPETSLCVNFSPRQFAAENLVDVVFSAITRHRIPKGVLHMEITEGTMMENIDEVIERMQVLKSVGARMAIDDFGTGFSSMNYLKKMPVDFLKIDQSFISSLMENDLDRVITGAMIRLAQDLNLGVIAEGVESETVCDALLDIDCQLQQGYMHGYPMTLERLTDWINAGQPKKVVGSDEEKESSLNYYAGLAETKH